MHQQHNIQLLNGPVDHALLFLHMCLLPPEPNAGRDADLGRYSWSQSLSEVTVNVPVGAGLKAKQLDVVIKKQHLTVGVKGQEPVIDVSTGFTTWNGV